MSDLPETATVEATFVFADIAGFTALTEAHGDHDAAALVADFCRSVRAELPASGGIARACATPAIGGGGRRHRSILRAGGPAGPGSPWR
jgi:class 3 adenylate cyclase